jgi:putative phosphoribosyl transferase
MPSGILLPERPDRMEGDRAIDPKTVRIPLESGRDLLADLTILDTPRALVVFAHGSGSGRRSPRNRVVATRLQRVRCATLLLDLLTPEEAEEDERTAAFRFDVALLGDRVQVALSWAARQAALARLPVGLYGASTGGAAAMIAASDHHSTVRALVLRGARTDLAAASAARIKAPTLLVVGERDPDILAMNRTTLLHLRCEARLVVVPGASHLFEGPGSLDQVAELARAWFVDYLRRPYAGSD